MAKGKQATLMFYQRILDATAASTDQEHIPTLILSDTEMPDRTAALLSGETEPVRRRLLDGVRTLEQWGACCVAVPCNTSHAFLPWVQAQTDIPIIHMIRETAAALRANGVRRAGIMGTDGTLRMGLYHAACAAEGLEAVDPAPEEQKLVMSLIYDEIKAGCRGTREKFETAAASLWAQGCDCIVLACTELSVYRDWHSLDDRFIDPMDVTARRCVELCGYPLRAR